MALLNRSGQVTFLRVHDVGTGWGPPNDFMDVEVVFQLSDDPERRLGFKLRDDANRLVRQGMLDLLRDAFNEGWTVGADYELPSGKMNGVAIRVWLTRPAVIRPRILREAIVVGPRDERS